MKIIDLTHPISEKTPVYPGTPIVKTEQFATVKEDGFMEKYYSLPSHVGTHMDAPAHMLAQGRHLDEFSVDNFIGSAVLVDVSSSALVEIDTACLNDIPEIDFILFRTGADRNWGTPAYFSEFCYPSVALTDAIIQRRVKGIGLDAVSVDSISNLEYTNHLHLLKNNILIIENLTNLQAVPDVPFTFCALPVKFEEADGAPVRAIAIVE